MLRPLVDVGTACADYQDAVLRDLPCKRLQCDEIWAYCYAKGRHVERAKNAPPGAGDVWTWTAICRDTTLVPAWLVGHRTIEDGMTFMLDVAARMAGRVQITTDGLAIYLDSVPWAFHRAVGFAQFVKVYGGGENEERRYSPARYLGAKRTLSSESPTDARSPRPTPSVRT